MGAAAMSVVVAQRLKQQGYRVLLFSKCPSEDRQFAERYGIALRSANQLVYTLLVVPALVLTGWLPPARRWIRRRLFADIVAFYDVGGITFSASRGVSGFAINLTWLLLPLLLGLPVVKGSQAIGPFSRSYLKLAPALLRRVDRIYARGADSERYLLDAGVPCERVPDIAFLLAAEPAPIPRRPYIAIVPSTVVMRRYDGVHGRGAYSMLMARVAADLASTECSIVVLAHSYRRDDTPVNNDYPLSQLIVQQANSPNVGLYDVFGKTPGQLKTVLGHGEVVLTSRFHAMVASLGSCVPVVVASWSHKYREVVETFGLADWVVPWEEMTRERLVERVVAARAQRRTISETLKCALPGIHDLAERNFRGICALTTEAG
jgi:polysaccharide pyruvyl transferase WcaK-like protein